MRVLAFLILIFNVTICIEETEERGKYIIHFVLGLEICLIILILLPNILYCELIIFLRDQSSFLAIEEVESGWYVDRYYLLAILYQLIYTYIVFFNLIFSTIIF